MWHVVFEDKSGRIESQVARSRDAAIQTACELMKLTFVVRRALGPGGVTIEQAELEEHYDEGRFPGLRNA
jgi:hypothetical protein